MQLVIILLWIMILIFPFAGVMYVLSKVLNRMGDKQEMKEEAWKRRHEKKERRV